MIDMARPNPKHREQAPWGRIIPIATQLTQTSPGYWRIMADGAEFSNAESTCRRPIASNDALEWTGEAGSTVVAP